MKIGVVSTTGSVCGCADALAGGLRELGHEPVLADCEQIERRAAELARECAWVIDHTDTFRGKGLLRPVVRGLLEARGARLVGSGSAACARADDKQAAKAVLAAAGVPTVPGITVTSELTRLPSWLVPPLVVKPAFEHMSRGLAVARTEAEGCALAGALLRSTGQPVLVERFVPGREIGVCVLDGPRGPEVLPLIQWRLREGAQGVLAAGFKELSLPEDRDDLVPADLPPGVEEEVRLLAVAAFRALGLEDYARFDVRLSAGGTPFFLEANVTPSLERNEALAAAARWAGLDYPALVGRLLEAAAWRHRGRGEHTPETLRVDLPSGPLDLLLPAWVHRPPPSTLELARLLDVEPGDTVLDLGCGSGLLSLAAARLGAAQVVAADLDPAALEATEENARRNGLGDRIVTRAGSWFEALEGAGERFQVIVATPPQTPAPFPLGPRYGGPDGTRHLAAVVAGAARFLDPARGRLWLLALSLANPGETKRLLAAHFADVSVRGASDRRFSRDEYEELQPGLFRHLVALRASGRSEFRDRDDGTYTFQNCFYRAALPAREAGP